jgi:hypothetical protein
MESLPPQRCMPPASRPVAPNHHHPAKAIIHCRSTAGRHYHYDCGGPTPNQCMHLLPFTYQIHYGSKLPV